MNALSMELTPGKWPEVLLGDLLSDAEVFSDGDWVESKDQDPNGDVRLIQLADVGDGCYLDKSARFLTHDKAVELGCTFLEPRDVLVARMPDPLGRACIFPGDAKKSVTVVDVCIIRPNRKRIDSNWLAHTINSPEFRQRISGFVSGTTRQRVSRGNLAKLSIPVPSLSEQRRIAAILDKADALRAKRRKAIAKLDQLLQAVFLDMFGDPVTGPKSDVVPLYVVCSRVTDGTHQSPRWVEDGVPFLFQSNVKPGDISYETKKMISLEEHESLTSRCPIEYGDVLYTIVGSYGNAAMVRSREKFCFQRHIAHLKPKADMLPEFLEAMMNHPAVKRQADERVTGIAQKTLILKELREIKVMKPSLEDQAKFRDFSNKVRRCRDQVLEQAGSAEAFFASLQHRAFNGAL